MIFEYVVVGETSILLEDKIVSPDRDTALVAIGRELERNEIEHADVKQVVLRPFVDVPAAPSVQIIGGDLKLTGTVTVPTPTVQARPIWVGGTPFPTSGGFDHLYRPDHVTYGTSIGGLDTSSMYNGVPTLRAMSN